MKIILPVAGKGTRLRPHTHTRAKSLVHVAGKAILEHIVRRILPLSPCELIFIKDDNGSQIEEFMNLTFPEIKLPLHCPEGAKRSGPRGFSGSSICVQRR